LSNKLISLLINSWLAQDLDKFLLKSENYQDLFFN
jgi:hypothetical protein